MIDDTLKDTIDSLFPSDKEIDDLIFKLKNNIELDIFDLILIKKLKLLHLIKKGKGVRI